MRVYSEYERFALRDMDKIGGNAKHRVFFSKMKSLTALIFFTVVSLNAFADRTLLIPPLRIGALHDFRKDMYGNATGYSEGTRLMVGIELFISLQNLGTRATEGTVEITDSGTFESLLDASSCCPGRHMKPTVSICSGTDGDFKSGQFNTTLTVPKAVKWTLAAGGKSYVLVSGVFEGEFSTTNSTRFSVATLYFRPTLKLVVKDERGSVSASLTARYLLTDSYPTCDNGTRKTVTGTYGNYLNQPEIQQLPPLNGGRPF